MSRITVFLSHSSKDIEKVRKLRDILEALEYDPLLFYLKCLDDDNENLESFLKKEIEARNIFIYCKSKNADNSPWVQKELEYIKSFDNKRLFTIDITLPLRHTLVQLLESITAIIKKNRVFISCSHDNPDKMFGDYLERILIEQNYDVVRFNVLDTTKDHEHKRALAEACTFISVISRNSMDSVYCRSELERALYAYEDSPATFTNRIIPVFYGVSRRFVLHSEKVPTLLEEFPGIETSVDCSLTPDEEKELFDLICQTNNK